MAFASSLDVYLINYLVFHYGSEKLQPSFTRWSSKGWLRYVHVQHDVLHKYWPPST